jgi:Raf kinase inhibitor-like YbhB/YbcL family protein
MGRIGSLRLAVVGLAILALAGCGPGRAKTLALGQAPAKASQPMTLTSDAFVTGGPIDLRHSGYGANLSPALHWTAVPGAGAYAIVLEDPDAPQAKPFVHWTLWNIPAGASDLPEGIPPEPTPAAPHGARQGANDNGGVGYYGPHPPGWLGRHHYHYQVFALDGPLALPAGAAVDALITAMRGHVLAEGELVGKFRAPAGPK